jgi:hypothetical protein
MRLFGSSNILLTSNNSRMHNPTNPLSNFLSVILVRLSSTDSDYSNFMITTQKAQALISGHGVRFGTRILREVSNQY